MPTAKVAEPALVKAGAWPTTMVKAWVASGLIPLAAVIVRLVVPVAVGVPAMVAVPSLLSVNVSPAGSVPDSVIAAVGDAGRGDRDRPELVQREVSGGTAGDGRRSAPR